MYAIIDDNGKQYKVREGEVVFIDLEDAEPGSEIKFENVILISADGGVRIGQPKVEGASVVGVIEGEAKDKKVFGQHRLGRNRCQTRKGHRQKYTGVKITKIQA
jgi:large subunit ribosomal protein L21